jgi:hypothetical protein
MYSSGVVYKTAWGEKSDFVTRFHGFNIRSQSFTRCLGGRAGRDYPPDQVDSG